MAIIYTGMQRATELVVKKIIDGKYAEGYPRVYRLYDEFGKYPSVTKTRLAELSVDDFIKRLEAFKKYVESIEIGVQVDTSEAYRENTTECPINNELTE